MLRTGQPYSSGSAPDGASGSNGAPTAGAAAGESSSHRARAARGPTDLEGLTAAMGVQEGDQEGREQAQDDAESAAGGARTAAARAGQAAAALKAADAVLDAAAWDRLLSAARIQLVCGDLKKQLTGRRGLAGSFQAATLGCMHVHLASPQHGLASMLTRGAPLLIEGADNFVQLNNEQAAAFQQRAVEIASGTDGEGKSALEQAELGGAAAVQPGCTLLLRK